MQVNLFEYVITYSKSNLTNLNESQLTTNTAYTNN